MTAPSGADPRIRLIESSGTANEVWAAVDGSWLFERYGDSWCAIERINTMRLPSPGNPFASLGSAVACTLRDPQ